MASADNKIVEIFIPGPAGRLEAKYFNDDLQKEVSNFRNEMLWQNPIYLKLSTSTVLKSSINLLFIIFILIN